MDACFEIAGIWFELVISVILHGPGRTPKLKTTLLQLKKPMPEQIHSERDTQNRIVKLFQDKLGYRNLGKWGKRSGNSNIDEPILIAYLKSRGYDDAHISKAIYAFCAEAGKHSRSLYENNKAVYGLLRYGVSVKTEPGKPSETVWLIDWKNPNKNDFAIAEEVTLSGAQERRPDLVLYVNGIAVGVIELKNSRVSIGAGIRQLLSNQSKESNGWFFSTVQFVFAGNDSEGLKYGAVGTPEKYFLTWKEDVQDNVGYQLDKYLQKMCGKDRLIEFMHDFVLFDGGVKKLPRVHQYFGIKKAQACVNAGKGGIIWHTQGSGKSIVMVLLAKWILETKPNARVVIVTDRDELDKQIEGVFREAGESISRTSSGRDLMNQLGQAAPRLLCSLVHKFGPRGVDDFDAFIREIKEQPCKTVGDVFVFVDECHRTQSGKLHSAMSALMRGAVFIGFTGTPLLKKDKQTSEEIFGDYIHTYKFNEGVADGVVLDLIYEARDIDQQLGSQDRIDAWFDSKTSGLNDWQKAALRERWGTMQTVLSSKSRMERVVQDVVLDFSTKPRLNDSRGNALLVVSSIYDACKYFELFQVSPLKNKSAVVTSYNPESQNVTCEETGANTETDRQFIYNTYTKLLQGVGAEPGKSKTETYEDQVKTLFKQQPMNMKLLIVVDKLLTGFDAPPCTYLYIDKSMQDHGLFQAICRVNRLDGESKDFGYIVDYKNLLPKVENAISVYTSELAHRGGSDDTGIQLQGRLEKGRERLDAAIESIALLCEPVDRPRELLDFMHYFCGNSEIQTDLAEHEPQRVAFYKATVVLVRAYANIADQLSEAGYSDRDIVNMKRDVTFYTNMRESIRLASNETIDLKAYEADMRHLIDTYIEADESRKISPFNDMPLMELIVKSGMGAAIDSLPDGLKTNREAVAETIANNVRSTIVKNHLNDPVFYNTMSSLLEEILASLKRKTIEYEEYLRRMADLASKLQIGHGSDMPVTMNTPGRRALYNNLGNNCDLAIAIDETVKRVRPDDWRGNLAKERIIKAALLPLLGNLESEVERIFVIIQQQRDY